MKSTLKDGAGKNLLVESTIFTGNPSGAKGNFREQIFALDCNNSEKNKEVIIKCFKQTCNSQTHQSLW